MERQKIINKDAVKENMKAFRAEKKAQLIEYRNQKKIDKAAKKQSRYIAKFQKNYLKAGGSLTGAIAACNTLAEDNGSSQVIKS